MTHAQARVFGMLSLLALAISTAAFAAKPVIGSPTIGDAAISASAIQWQASGAYERLTLTVSGPEDYSLSKEFDAGQGALLRVQDLGAKVPVDGNYTWELRVAPLVSAETRRRLAAAREASDDEAASRIQAETGLNREIVKSGAFTIRGGSFVSSGSEEPSLPGGRKIVADALKPKPLDQVIPDDLIVQGSACIGLDCVNNESFGFDTIRLKENNTRIRFEDTSVGTCPSNDWLLTANDPCPGANKFSIEDITGNKVPFTITAGAATNSIFLDSTGRLGLRTSTPVLDLHISTSNTPAIRQEQTNAGGFTAQTWDIGANEANWFVRDVTGGSRLPFRIRPGAPTSSIDISASGNVGIGTASPAAKLTIASDGSAVRIQQTDPTAFAGFTWYEGTTQKFAINALGSTSGAFGGANAVQIDQISNAPMIFMTNGTERMRITGGGNIGLNNVPFPTNPIQHSSGASLTAVGVWADASSRALKEDIRDIDSAEARATLLRLEPVKFFYKADPQDQHAGFIAEDVPELVATKDRKTLSSMDIVAVLTKVVQDQQKLVQDQAKIIGELTQRVEQLEKDGHKSDK